MTLQALRETTDDRIVHETNRELKDLEDELKALRELNLEIAGLVQSQTVPLRETEVKTDQVAKEVIKTEKVLKEAVKEKSNTRKFALFMGAGGVTGSAVGAVGFAINPVVGAVAVVVMGLLGAGAGGLASKIG